MTRVIRLIPGLLAAMVAYWALQFMKLLELSRLGEFGLFLIIYIAVALLAEKAIKTYAEKEL